MTEEDKAAFAIEAVHVNYTRFAAGPTSVRLAFAEGMVEGVQPVFRVAVEMSRSDAQSLLTTLGALLEATASQQVSVAPEDKAKWN